MKVLIDADGCPVVHIAAEICAKRKIDAVIVCDTSHYFNIDGVQTIVVDKGADSADFVLANHVNKGDIAITQDYGLAAMVLAKKGYCINQNGMYYTAENIDSLLLRRHIGKKIRRAGGKTTSVKKRVSENDEKFKIMFERLIDTALKNN